MGVAGQTWDTLTPVRERTLYAPILIPSTVVVDSVMILPGSVRVTPPLDTAVYSIDYGSARWRWHRRPPVDSVRITYVPIPISARPVRRYTLFDILDTLPSRVPRPAAAAPQPPPSSTALQMEGYMQRHIEGGTRYPAVLRSEMALALHGEVWPEWDLEAALSDNRLPTSAGEAALPLAEAQQVFLRLRGPTATLHLGTLRRRADSLDYFVRYDQSGQGLAVEYHPEGRQMEAFYAFVPGTFHRLHFNAQDNFGGPYLLKGRNGEFPITIIPSSERVFLNGMLLRRGEDADYEIDYLSGTLSFTPRHVLRATDRITVEFRYAARAYSRSGYGVRARFHGHPHWQWRVGFYGEEDLRGRPRLFPPDPETIARLAASSGEAVAISDGIDSTPSAGAVRYAVKDTLGHRIFYYSTHPDSARYQVFFSYVGPGRGDYIRTTTPANQTVYRWVAPINGRPQGDYAPGVYVEPPRRHRMVEIQGQWSPHPRLALAVTTALSDLDSNTYARGGPTTVGGAARGWAQWVVLPRIHAVVEAEHQWRHARFRPVERIRNPEFERRWIPTVQAASLTRWWETPVEEHLSEVRLSARPSPRWQLRGYTGRLTRTALLESNRLEMAAQWSDSVTSLRVRAEGWQGRLPIDSTAFSGRRPSVEITRRFRRGRLTFKGLYEESRFTQNGHVIAPSEARWKARPAAEWRFHQWQLAAAVDGEDYRSTADSARRHRWLTPTLTVGRSGTALQWHLQAAHQYDAFNPSAQQPTLEMNASGRRPFRWRIRYRHQPRFQRFETFRYVKVTPGQGTHTWTDYNGNGVAEVGEFEPAPFPHLAEYIRVRVPTDSFIALRLHHGRIRLETGASTQKGARWNAELTAEGTSYTQTWFPVWDWQPPDSARTHRNRFRTQARFRLHHPSRGWHFRLFHQVSGALVPYPYGFQWRRRRELSGLLRYIPPRHSQWEFRLEARSEERRRVQTYASLPLFTSTTSEASFGLLRLWSSRFRTDGELRFQRGVVSDTAAYPFAEWRLALRAEYSTRHRMRMSAAAAVRYIESPPLPSPQTQFLAFEGMAPGWNGEATLTAEYPLSSHLQFSFQTDYRHPADSPPLIVGSVGLRYVF